ncbi:protein ENHANCED DOWNY MILDEW 2-like [Wolffia australiana]
MKASLLSEPSDNLVSEIVNEYQLGNEVDEPICFSLLPIQWPENGRSNVPKIPVYLKGSVDNGLQKIYRQVVAWRFDIKGTRPKVWVFSKDQVWYKLEKPRRAYEPIVRGVLVTLQCLVYLRKSPNSSDKSLWDHVRANFGHFEIKATKSDLLNHLTLMKMMAKRDEKLSSSQLLCNYLKDLPKLCNSDEKMEKLEFINDYDTDGSSEDDGSDDKDECFDSVCAFCDDGGELLCCEGKCLRSFHATPDAADLDSGCMTLGYTRAFVDEMPSFFCPNCSLKTHQCFACGKLGDSDASNAEVFRCISASCGHYYHPRCAANLLFPENKEQAADLEIKIACGEPFICSAHKCSVCNQVENKNVKELQFAMCRRCPLSYHRKCLPRDISLQDLPEEGIKQRAWDGLIPNRILIYCWRHEIDESLCTPSRDHIKFPDAAKEKVKHILNASHVKPFQKRKYNGSQDKVDNKLAKKVNKDSGNRQVKDQSSNGLGHADYNKSIPPVLRTSVDGHPKGDFVQERVIPSNDVNAGLTEITKNLSSIDSENNFTPIVPLSYEKSSKVENAKIDAKKRIMHLVENAPHMPLKSATTNLMPFDKRITQGKVEGAIEAVRAALRRLENGCSIEDAKAVCGPDVLKLLLRWKTKFGVYLAPFLHGTRYTSYGRHFTHVHILEEIVERLHWYVQSNDMIVDFCCGANDFSLLMKEKLDAKRKRCSFKNYDLLTPKNDFNFEKRDWMKVHPRELPTGHQLIMGLNPPFSHANKFIDKALEFKPKLIILIAPTKTKRLDQKSEKYDLIWEDNVIVSRKSFYFPGSIDSMGEQIDQWNVNAPSLALWSRRDWTPIHKAIAEEQNHLFKNPESTQPNPMTAYPLSPSESSLNRMETSLPSEEQPIANDDIFSDKDMSPPREMGYPGHRLSAGLSGHNSFGTDVAGYPTTDQEKQASSYLPYRRNRQSSHYNEQRPLQPGNDPTASCPVMYYINQPSSSPWHSNKHRTLQPDFEPIASRSNTQHDNEASLFTWVRGVEPMASLPASFDLNEPCSYTRLRRHDVRGGPLNQGPEPICGFPGNFRGNNARFYTLFSGHGSQQPVLERDPRSMVRYPDIYHENQARSNDVRMHRSIEWGYKPMVVWPVADHAWLEEGRHGWQEAQQRRPLDPGNDRTSMPPNHDTNSNGWLVE